MYGFRTWCRLIRSFCRDEHSACKRTNRSIGLSGSSVSGIDAEGSVVPLRSCWEPVFATHNSSVIAGITR
jgi:hypothetical protein